MTKLNTNEKREFKREFVLTLFDVLNSAYAREAFAERGLEFGEGALSAVGVVFETKAGLVAVDGIVKAESFDLADSVDLYAERERKREEAIAKKLAKSE